MYDQTGVVKKLLEGAQHYVLQVLDPEESTSNALERTHITKYPLKQYQ